MADQNPTGSGAAVALALSADQVRFLRSTFQKARVGVKDELEEFRDQLDPERLRREEAALHQVALTQARVHPEARAYLDKKRAEGKTTKEAFRCLKRHLVRVVWRAMQEPASPAEAVS
ncbi:MAG: transposase [Solirubrobacterales bacterium]|jgi:hypothetical protein|nr:transposase [Solirubrobacterales bacterium]